MKKILTLVLIAILLLFTSCTNDVSAPDESWEGIFLTFWNTMNSEYAHFSDDTSLDWDDVYDEYLPKFQTLDFSKSEDSLAAFKYFKEIVWNLKDYHYTIGVFDNFGNKLVTKPAMLQKWAAGDSSRDIMEFPDIRYGDKITSVKYSNYEYSDDERASYNMEAIESYYEVKDLLSKSTRDNYFFHTTNGILNEDFKEMRGEYIEPLASYEVKKEEEAIADEWNIMLAEEGISEYLMYFYGTTKDDIFYFYFSNFFGGNFLDERLTKNEEDLTEKDKQDLASNSELKEKRDEIQKFNNQNYPTIYNEFKKVQGFTNMFTCIKSIATTNTLNVKGVDTEIKGIVMDLRGNGGGYNYFLESLMSSFFSDEIVFGYSRYKDGYSRLEYTPWMEVYLKKTDVSAEVEKTYDKPFVVLVNGKSVSCAELATLIVKNHLPNSCVIGQPTYGGTCTMADRTIYNGGTFSSAYLTIKTTTYQIKDINGVSFETKGITPDIQTDLDPEKDNAFIEAIKWINSQTT